MFRVNAGALFVVGVWPFKLPAEVTEREDGGLLVVELELAVASRTEVNKGLEFYRFLLRYMIPQTVDKQRVHSRVVVLWRGCGYL